MLYLMSHNSEALPSANTQTGQPPQLRPLTMDEMHAICKVVDFKCDLPREAKQHQAETMRFAMKSSYSFMSLELFSRLALGRKLALYAAESGFFLSFQTENTPQMTEYREQSAFRFLRINCSCLRATRLKVSLENEPQFVFNQLHTCYNLGSLTWPMTLGTKAYDVSFTAERRNAILRKIGTLKNIPNMSLSLFLNFSYLFRRVWINEAAVLSVPSRTTHLDSMSEVDCIHKTSKQELSDSCKVATVLYKSSIDKLS